MIELLLDVMEALPGPARRSAAMERIVSQAK
jgi:hypothetical protein